MDTNAGWQVGSRPASPKRSATTGPAILSYGFRPFFLGAGILAVVAMAGWIGALTLSWRVGGSYGALNWHAHEMLFGYAGAALAGFMLTAIPNWTGRLPVSGLPLLALVGLWLAGRMVLFAPDVLGMPASMIIEAMFMPLLAAIAGREIVAGKNWKNLKLLFALVALSATNIAFHISVAKTGAALEVSRFGVSTFVVLVVIVGGRIIPSFTRNWLVKAKASALPKPFGQFDTLAIAILLLALVAWVALPEDPWSAALAATAAAFHLLRLFRWQGWRTTSEPLLLVLHLAYGFVPLGMLCVALAEWGIFSQPSALHVLTVGVIGNMTFAVMTRVSLGHTGRALRASLTTRFAYVALLLAAALRPLAELYPDTYDLMLSVSGVCWLVAFVLFLLHYGPILWSPRALRG